MPQLRGHHFICLHFFNGEGYDDEFIANLRDLLSIVEGEAAEVLKGADDVCRKCRHLKEGICQYDENAEEEIQQMDKKALELLRYSYGEKVKWEEARRRLPEIFAQWYTAFCLDCDWIEVCKTNELYQKVKP
jgi:hypothetical protein